MGPAATFYTPEQIKQVSAVLGIAPDSPTIVYCETGGQASLGWFVFHELLGNKHVSIYDGSMNAWGADDSRPVVTMKIE